MTISMLVILNLSNRTSPKRRSVAEKKRTIYNILNLLKLKLTKSNWILWPQKKTICMLRSAWNFEIKCQLWKVESLKNVSWFSLKSYWRNITKIIRCCTMFCNRCSMTKKRKRTFQSLYRMCGTKKLRQIWHLMLS